jgi:hypothetical protein
MTIQFLNTSLWESSDVKEPSRVSGWRTALIVSELDHEIRIQNTPEYRERLRKLIELEDLYQRLDLLSGRRHELMREIEDEIRTHRHGRFCFFANYLVTSRQYRNVHNDFSLSLSLSLDTIEKL